MIRQKLADDLITYRCKVVVFTAKDLDEDKHSDKYIEKVRRKINAELEKVEYTNVDVCKGIELELSDCFLKSCDTIDQSLNICVYVEDDNQYDDCTFYFVPSLQVYLLRTEKYSTVWFEFIKIYE